MIGTNQIIFMQNRIKITNYLQTTNVTKKFCYIFDSLLSCVRTLSNTFCKHNYEIFDDKYIINLKKCVDQFNILFIKYVDSCSVGYGQKFHWINHMYEWTSHYRISTSWLDEQRIESLFPFLRQAWQKYKRLGEKQQLLYIGKYHNNKVLLRNTKKTKTKKIS